MYTRLLKQMSPSFLSVPIRGFVLLANYKIKHNKFNYDTALIGFNMYANLFHSTHERKFI